MGLNIEGASIGFDANGVQAALNNLNTRVIQDTINAMNASMASLRESVDQAWVGQSAEQFKNNMETDKNNITKALNDTFSTLKTEFNNIISRMSEADEQLVKERGD